MFHFSSKQTLLIAPLLLIFSLTQCCMGDDETTIAATNFTEHLGTNSWLRFRPGWLLTVNDQCLYEFTFEFEHDDTLPMGANDFTRNCVFNNGNPFVAKEDGIPYLDARMHWEEFPPYVWAAMGFNHLSIDWYPCGTYPGGYATPQYHFSFFRVTPDFRANTMTCKLAEDQIVPGDKICLDKQPEDNPNGRNFFILPASILPVSTPDRTLVSNMPTTFSFSDGGAPRAHQGLRLNDQSLVPPFPAEWDDVQLFMSSYGGDLAMWQPRIAFHKLNGTEDQFTSNAKRYHQTTLVTLPDTFAFDYDASDGLIRFHMIGKSQLCKNDFENARAYANGAPVFPNYNDLAFVENYTKNGWGDSNGDGTSRSAAERQAGGMMVLLLSIGLVLFSL